MAPPPKKKKKTPKQIETNHPRKAAGDVIQQKCNVIENKNRNSRIS
jgi:hypothetical protein